LFSFPCAEIEADHAGLSTLDENEGSLNIPRLDDEADGTLNIPRLDEADGTLNIPRLDEADDSLNIPRDSRGFKGEALGKPLMS